MTNNLLETAKKDYPTFVFKPGRKFLFHPPKTILFNENDPHFDASLLHELGHALLKHRDFKTDLERVKMESDAWEKAKELASLYGLSIEQDLIDTELDSYRNWLHTKSKCKICGLTRYQTPDGAYHCPRCDNF